MLPSSRLGEGALVRFGYLDIVEPVQRHCGRGGDGRRQAGCSLSAPWSGLQEVFVGGGSRVDVGGLCAAVRGMLQDRTASLAEGQTGVERTICSGGSDDTKGRLQRRAVSQSVFHCAPGTSSEREGQQ